MEPDAKPTPRSYLLRFVLACQWAVAVFLFVAPFGFDKPSQWGLDFDDFVLCGILLIGLSILAVVLAIIARSGGAIVASSAPVVFGLARLFLA
jgi:hypothetical protein